MKTLPPQEIGEQARRRLLSIRGEPLFYASWDNALFLHYETSAAVLQRAVPYALDLYDGRAFVSLVAFRLREMRPRLGGRLGALLFRPIATHNFLNVRTYVRHRGEPAIYFMHEWLDNRLSVLLGPTVFGLPYHHATIAYRDAGLRGHVRAAEGAFNYRAEVAAENYETCAPGSLAEHLIERYTAFTPAGRSKRFFRIWHLPWQQAEARVEIENDDLIAASGEWWQSAKYIGAHYSPGVDVWMGRPHRVRHPGAHFED